MRAFGFGKVATAGRLLALGALGACMLLPSRAYSAASQDKFELMDANKDGKVVLEEFRAAFPNMNERAFSVIDKNDDKGIDRAEWQEFIENHGKRPGAGHGGAPVNSMSGTPMMPPPGSNDLPLVRPPSN